MEAKSYSSNNKNECSSNNESLPTSLKKKKDMKNILILLTVLLPLVADGQNKSSFSAREMADVWVVTPGLFAKGNHIDLHLRLLIVGLPRIRSKNHTEYESRFRCMSNNQLSKSNTAKRAIRNSSRDLICLIALYI